MKGFTMKKIKGFCFIILLITISFAFFMCSPVRDGQVREPIKKESVFYWNLDLMPRFFFPSMALNESEKEVVNHLYEGLTRVIDDQVLMGMAENVTFDDSGLEYTFTLRKAQWSDGRMVKPEDFIYGWERSENYVDGVNLLYLDAYIDETWIEDEDKIVIKLKQKNKNLLHQLSYVAFMPIRSDVVDLDKPLPIQLGNITNGPYYLSHYHPEDGLILKKNIHYYDFFEVNIKEIHCSLDFSFPRVYSRVNQDQIDFAQNVDWYNIDYYVAYEPKLRIYKDLSKYAFVFNHKHPILSKVEIRKLLKAAVDIEAINPYFETISSSIEQSSFSGVVDQDIDFLVPLAESEDLENLYGLKIVTRNNHNAIRVGKLLAENWRAFLGIECVVEPKDTYDYYRALNDGDYDVILTTLSYNPTNPWTFLKNFWGDQPLNKLNYFSEDYNRLMYQAYVNQDQLYLMEAQKLLEDSSVFFTVFPRYDAVFIQDTVKNWSRSHEGLFYFGRSSILKRIDQE